MIKTKSIYYDDEEPDDGTCILVMRRWPRGIPKDLIDEWRKDLGPSMELLRQWNDEEIDFAGFQERYLEEIQDKIEEVQELAMRARTEIITLLCHEESQDHYHRRMLKELIEQRMSERHDVRGVLPRGQRHWCLQIVLPGLERLMAKRTGTMFCWLIWKDWIATSAERCRERWGPRHEPLDYAQDRLVEGRCPEPCPEPAEGG